MRPPGRATRTISWSACSGSSKCLKTRAAQRPVEALIGEVKVVRIANLKN
jgi:hypothetical protein